ncbi:Zinc finger, C2H2 [Artemisia annua]|uniref:Zinc finger, C2H2 n=1 Tax=Artemisia annua TaxID=35608 RepID=A0A2U1MGC2_ARTAN|nr:Zinc finger, C2H2 [Artemisia annua]
MEEEMINLSNIMPVELAIARELEYRKKMEVLNNRQMNLKPLVPPQGPPTQAKMENTQSPPNVSQKSPMLQFLSSSPTFKERAAFSCRACQLTFATVFHLSGHVVGQEHKVNVSEMKKRKEAISNPICIVSSIVCLNVPVSESQTTVDRKRKVEACSAQCSQTLLRSTSGRSSPRFICVTCNAAFADLFNLTMHGETTSHKSKVSQSKKLAGNNIPNPFLCELCDILCSSSLVMGSHVNGLKHRAYLKEFDAKRARTLRNLGF